METTTVRNESAAKPNRGVWKCIALFAGMALFGSTVTSFLWAESGGSETPQTAAKDRDDRALYIAVLRSSLEIDLPDLARYGASRGSKWKDRLVVRIHPSKVAELRADPKVRFVQRAVIGPYTEPIDNLSSLSTEVSSVASDRVREGGAAMHPHASSPTSLAIRPMSGPSWTSGEYVYDGAGNITAIGTAALPATGGNNGYVYDELSRLKEATVYTGASTVPKTYNYDSFGNLRQTEMAVYAADRLTNQLTGNPGFTYDMAGNLTSFGATDGYDYDPFNNLKERSASTGFQEFYVYTAGGERIGVRNNGTGDWKWTLRDLSGKPLRQFESSTQVTCYTNPQSNPEECAFLWVEDYVWGNGQLMGSQRQAEEGGRRHVHLDHLGTPRVVTNQNRAVVGEHYYYPFGIEASSMRQDVVAGLGREEPLRFTGHEREFSSLSTENTAYLDYMHARYYNPNLGRFLSVDPVLNKGALRKPQLWNRYSYVSNNPLGFVDPDGRLLQLSGCVKDQSSDACKGQMSLYLSTFGNQSGEAAKYLTVGKNGIVGFNGISGSAFAAKFGLMGRATNYLVSNRAATFSLVTGRTATTEGHRGAYFDGDNRVGGTIGIDPSRFPNSKHFFGITVSASEALAHEMGHAVGSLIPGHAHDVAMRKALLPIAQIGWGETYASAFQNAWRHEVLGVSTYRSGYSLVPNEFGDSTTADVFP